MATDSPPNFPPRTLDVNRALCALSEQANGQKLLVKALAKLWYGFWVNHVDIANPDVYGAILADAVGKATAEQGMPISSPTLVLPVSALENFKLLTPCSHGRCVDDWQRGTPKEHRQGIPGGSFWDSMVHGDGYFR